MSVSDPTGFITLGEAYKRLHVHDSENALLRIKNHLRSGVLECITSNQHGLRLKCYEGFWTDPETDDRIRTGRIGEAKLLVDEERFERLFPECAKKRKNKRSKAGRKQDYDRELFFIICFRLLQKKKFRSQAALIKMALDEFSLTLEEDDESPTNDWAKPFVSRLWHELNL